jgi:Ca-activated chloride channel family protein
VVGFSATGLRKSSYEGTPALLELIGSLQAGGQTALYDAICNACIDDFMTGEENSPVRRVLVLVSDGEDTQSRHNLSDVIASALRADITVYAISLHSARYEFRGDRILQEMASATGGRAFILSSHRQVEAVFAQIEARLRSQYVVTYRRSQAPAHGGFHPVAVTPGKNLDGAKVSCRRGYYVGGDGRE